jgi:hypothetical protein
MIAFNPDLAKPPEKGLLCSGVESRRAPGSITVEPTEAEEDAIVGVAGEMEHGGACVHLMLRKPMRAASAAGKRSLDRTSKWPLRARFSMCRSGIRTIPGRSRISIRSLCQLPMRLDPTKFWS